jgi:integrase
MEKRDNFANFLRNQKVSAHTAQSYLTITKLLFSFHGLHIKHTYKIPRQDKQAFDLKHEKRWFSGEDIALCKTYMFRNNHIRNHLIVRLMCETGARINEIANISVCDVKLKHKTILLSLSKTTPRPVFFTPETAIYLGNHLKTSFPNLEKNSFKKISPGKNMIYKIIDRMLKDLGLKTKGDGRDPHTFRHYVATNLRYNFKMDLDHVARLLGDTQKTISSRYLHPTAEMLHNLINKASGW